MSGDAPQFLMVDPYHDYAMRYLEVLHRSLGWRAVCMFLHPEALRMNARSYPLLRSPGHVAASYRVSESAIPEFAEYLRRRHDIRAVIPHYEPSVRPAAEIAGALGLSWVQPHVLRRFRDKRALKAYLTQADPGLRVNAGHIVHSPAEAVRVADANGMRRFVLKPNEGFGNVDVGFFSLDGPRAAVDRYWAKAASRDILLEEYIAGEEYHCDGQTDADGNVVVTDVMRYLRVPFNGRDNIEHGSVQVRHDSVTFRTLAGYVERVVRTSGLRRSPFHAEVKIDDRGPCLIECAARLVGAHTAPLVNWAHGGSLDVFDLAAHYYVTDEPYGDPGLDWAMYDSRLCAQVCGLAPRTERVYSLTGVDDVQGLPGFLGWLKKLAVGQRLHATTDIFGSAYIAAIQGKTEAELDETRQQVLQLVRWNVKPPTVSDRARANAALADRRLRQLPTAWELRMPRFEG